MDDLTQASSVPHEMTTTGFDLPGYQVVHSLGVVRGVVVRSRSSDTRTLQAERVAIKILP